MSVDWRLCFRPCCPLRVIRMTYEIRVRPAYSDPEKAARKLIANGVEVVQDGRIYIELLNGPFLAPRQ